MRYTLITLCGLMLCLGASAQSVEKMMAKDALEVVTFRDSVRTVLIDGRSAAMFAEKHIAGATNVDAFADSLSQDLEKYLDKKTIIVYCSNSRRAATIVEELKTLAYKGKIVFITDGINGWIDAGLKTTHT